ncbi:hypothetical protein QJS66_04675 [Kocuria rhizophila]|nr:hypothetical protein QJS66_04675 [Kocuria rhizophila]
MDDFDGALVDQLSRRAPLPLPGPHPGPGRDRVARCAHDRPAGRGAALRGARGPALRP